MPFVLRSPPDVIERPHAESHVLDSARNRWWFYPAMTRDECLLFVSGDTAERWPSVPHTSFAGAASAADGPPRASIEARVFVLFGDES